MGTFRFRLEALRNLRAQALLERRRATAEAVRAVQAIEEELGQLTTQLRETMTWTRDAQAAGPLDLTSLRGSQFYRGWLQRRILESGTERTEAQRLLDEERARLTDADTKLKVVEKLRERQWQRFQDDERRRAQLETDEAGLNVFRRVADLYWREVST